MGNGNMGPFPAPSPSHSLWEDGEGLIKRTETLGDIQPLGKETAGSFDLTQVAGKHSPSPCRLDGASQFNCTAQPVGGKCHRLTSVAPAATTGAHLRPNKPRLPGSVLPVTPLEFRNNMRRFSGTTRIHNPNVYTQLVLTWPRISP